MTEVPELPGRADGRCTKSADCTIVDDCCSGRRVIARDFANSFRESCLGMPCASPRDAGVIDAPRGVVCFEQQCLSTNEAAEIRSARARRAHDEKAHARWEREISRIEAELRSHDEIEPPELSR